MFFQGDLLDWRFVLTHGTYTHVYVHGDWKPMVTGKIDWLTKADMTESCWILCVIHVTLLSSLTLLVRRREGHPACKKIMLRQSLKILLGGFWWPSLNGSNVVKHRPFSQNQDQRSQSYVLTEGINCAGVKWVIRLQLILLLMLFIAVLDFTVGSFIHTDAGQLCLRLSAFYY